MIGITGVDNSVWVNAVQASALEELVPCLPSKGLVVVPSAMHRTALRRIWASTRAQDPVVPMLTTPQLHQLLASLLHMGMVDVGMLSGAEAELLFDLAIKDADETFRPPSLTASRLFRWKQEFLSPDLVENMFPAEDRPYELRDLDRVLKVWRAYEQRKGDTIRDRGDMAQLITDELARTNELAAMQLCVLATHGLARTDRMILHQLMVLGWDVGISFAAHPSVSNRSTSEAQWFVAHGWHYVGQREWQAPSQTVYAMRSPRDEVRRILGAIKELWKRGVSTEQMCIVLPEGGPYRDLLVEHAHAGVPLAVQNDRTLASIPVAALLHNLCTVVIDRWQRVDIERLAGSPALNETDVLRGLPAIAQKLRITGGMGSDEWIDRLKTQSTNTAVYNAAVQRLREVTELFQTECSTREFVTAITSAAALLGVQLPDALVEALKGHAEMGSRLNLPRLPLHVHTSQWWDVLSNTTLSKSPSQSGSVAVLQANEVRMRRFTVVFAPGLIEGVVPKISRDAVDQALLGTDAGEMELEQWADVQQAADQELVITWPKAVEGDTTLRSQFLLQDAEQEDAEQGDAEQEDVPELLRDIQSLNALQATLLLDHTDVLAFLEGNAIDKVRAQHGVQRDELLADARDVLDAASQVPLSPTRVDRAGNCPYVYFARDVLRIPSIDETDQSLTALERGTLMHAVAQRFFDAVRGTSITNVQSLDELKAARIDLTTHPLQAWMPLLLQVYHEQRANIPRGFLYDAVEESMLLDNDGRAGLLRRWLAQEYQLQEGSPFRPVLFEVEYAGALDLGFGMELVRLRIDRIDVAFENGEVHLAVVDYKSSKSSVPKTKAVKQGESTQPPLYVLAAQAWFAERGMDVCITNMRYHTFGRDIHKFDDPKVIAFMPMKNDDNDLTESSKTFLQGAQAGITAIRTGTFPVLPRDTACKNCELQELCRIESWGVAEFTN